MTAVSTEFAGQTNYFCSNHCLHAFEAGPRAADDRARHREVSHAH
jgi:YHS domain-containing protein